MHICCLDAYAQWARALTPCINSPWRPGSTRANWRDRSATASDRQLSISNSIPCLYPLFLAKHSKCFPSPACTSSFNPTSCRRSRVYFEVSPSPCATRKSFRIPPQKLDTYICCLFRTSDEVKVGSWARDEQRELSWSIWRGLSRSFHSQACALPALNCNSIDSDQSYEANRCQQ